MSQSCHVHDIRILRMNHDSPDVPRRLQPHFFPSLAAIERLVSAVAPGGALTVVRLARPDPHHCGVRRCDGDVADGRDTLLVEYRFPGRAVVRRFPYATRGCANVHDVGIALHDCEIIDAPAHRRRAKLAEFQILEFIGGIRLVARGLLRALPPNSNAPPPRQNYPPTIPHSLHFLPPLSNSPLLTPA